MSSRRLEPASHPSRRDLLVGSSPAFRRALDLIDKLAGCDATVLIRGETGTGKELAARAIHYGSDRTGQPFIPINCGAIADGLIESELFGAERGAFTDAKEARAGLVAQARGGTLLLDEVDMLDGRAQVVLLRFLEDREYRPVGGRIAHADVRIVAASNRCLHELVERGQFRQDLLFRLDLVCLELPALRERGDDVLFLAQRFSERYAQEYGQRARALHPETEDFFLRYGWPGNVRELQNLVHRQFLISDGPTIRISESARRPVAHARRRTDRPMEIGARTAAPQPAAAADVGCDFQTAKARAIERFERSYLAALLRSTNGNVSHAARISGKERSALGKLLKKHGIAREQFRRAGSAP